MAPRKTVTRRRILVAGAAAGAAAAMNPVVNLLADEQQPAPLELSWAKNFLTIRGRFPGDEIKIMYLDAYCRPGSTDRDWSLTVLSHPARHIPAHAPVSSILPHNILLPTPPLQPVIITTPAEL